MDSFNNRTVLAKTMAIEAGLEIKRILWDICVGSLLVEEAGGKCSSLNKINLDYTKIDKQIIIATNKKIHNEFENMINKANDLAI